MGQLAIFGLSSKCKAMRKIEIFCENNNQYKEYPLGTTLSQVAADMKIEMDE